MTTITFKFLTAAGMICLLALWSPDLFAAGKGTALLGTEGYFVKLPTGDIYLFPRTPLPTAITSREHQAGNKSTQTTNAWGYDEHSHASVRRQGVSKQYSQRTRCIHRYAQPHRIPPPPPPAFGYERDRHPKARLHPRYRFFMPRFDAAKNARR